MAPTKRKQPARKCTGGKSSRQQPVPKKRRRPTAGATTSKWYRTPKGKREESPPDDGDDADREDLPVVHRMELKGPIITLGINEPYWMRVIKERGNEPEVRDDQELVEVTSVVAWNWTPWVNDKINGEPDVLVFVTARNGRGFVKPVGLWSTISHFRGPQGGLPVSGFFWDTFLSLRLGDKYPEDGPSLSDKDVKWVDKYDPDTRSYLVRFYDDNEHHYRYPESELGCPHALRVYWLGEYDACDENGKPIIQLLPGRSTRRSALIVPPVDEGLEEEAELKEEDEVVAILWETNSVQQP